MAKENNFLDRLIGKLDAMDSNSIQAYILRLAREKGFLETVFNTIREGIVVIDRRLKIKYFNKSAGNLLGLPEDASKVRISQFLRGVDWKRILQQDEEEWYRLSMQEIEIMYPVRRVIHFYLVPHKENSGIATVILNDVTEAREQTLSEIETKKVHMISLLAAGVAHEIGNPLNSLYLHLQLLQRQCNSDDFDRGEAVELLQTAKGEVERLDNIINQFLSAVRPAKLEMRSLDIKECIVEALNFMKQEIQDRSVKVKCSWPDILPKISGDVDQLKQAFYNILKNALQAMPEGGEINISCSFDDEELEITFADNGSGIEAENISSIFEPYYTTKSNGSGLGLMIIERIFREHGAELAIESSPGKGTEFIIRFPRGNRRMRVLPAPDEDIEIEAIS